MELESTRNQLYENFQEVVQGVRLSAAQKGAALEERLQAQMVTFEQREVQLQEIMNTGGINVETHADIFGELESQLNTKRQVEEKLKYEVVRLEKLHNDCIKVFEAKFREYGIEAEDIRMQPLETVSGPGPAGLLHR